MKMSLSFQCLWEKRNRLHQGLLELSQNLEYVSRISKDNLHSLKFVFTGGAQYDRDHVVVNTVNEEKLTQRWEPLVV